MTKSVKFKTIDKIVGKGGGGLKIKKLGHMCEGQGKTGYEIHTHTFSS